jgi:hypothetical protein
MRNALSCRVSITAILCVAIWILMLWICWGGGGLSSLPEQYNCLHLQEWSHFITWKILLSIFDSMKTSDLGKYDDGVPLLVVCPLLHVQHVVGVLGIRDSVVVGALLQPWRSRARDPMSWMNFFSIYLLLPAAPALGFIRPLTEMSTRSREVMFLGV